MWLSERSKILSELFSKLTSLLDKFVLRSVVSFTTLNCFFDLEESVDLTDFTNCLDFCFILFSNSFSSLINHLLSNRLKARFHNLK